MSIESISLYYKEGSSDKEYHVHLEEKDGGYVVNYQHARRGSSLRGGTKTKEPLTLAEAKKIYDKIVASQLREGYTEGESGTPYSGSDMAGQLSGLVPQLSNAVDEARLQELLDDPNYLMQEKKDGNRLMIRYSGGEVTGSNRNGLVIPISSAIEAGVRELVGGGQAVIDGEAIGDVYHVFDLLEIDGEDLRAFGTEERWLRLQDLFGQREGGLIRLVPVSRKPWHKRQRFEQLKELGAEGVVFKRYDAPYTPGRPASGGTHLKFKFKATVTCKVHAYTKGKRSVFLSLFSGKEYVGVGKVTIPPNFAIPVVGSHVEVEYLYAYPGGSLFQPVYKGPRMDKDFADLYNTLKFKQGAEEEEA